MANNQAVISGLQSLEQTIARTWWCGFLTEEAIDAPNLARPRVRWKAPVTGVLNILANEVDGSVTQEHLHTTFVQAVESAVFHNVGGGYWWIDTVLTGPNNAV